MKRILEITFVALLLGLFACNNEKTEAIQQEEIPMSEEMVVKSATIAFNESEIEAATSETGYEVEFFANAEETLTKWWRIGKRFSWNNKLRYRVKNCPDVQISWANDSTMYPKTITLNYGKGTELNNGRVLSGVIEMVVTAPRKTRNYERVVTYKNFGVDSMIINGTSSMEIDKVDSMYRKISSNLEIALADGSTITRESERIWSWIAGTDTPDIQEDNVVAITGMTEATMTFEDGTEYQYTKEITEPLKKIGDCPYISEGVIQVTINGTVSSVMDYGYENMECDQYALLTNSEYPEGTVIDLGNRKSTQKKNMDKQNKGSNSNGQ